MIQTVRQQCSARELVTGNPHDRSHVLSPELCAWTKHLIRLGHVNMRDVRYYFNGLSRLRKPSIIAWETGVFCAIGLY